jgi:membrane protein
MIMSSFWNSINSFIWDKDLGEAPWYEEFPIKILRFIYVALRDFREEQLTLRAMSLVYTTILSLVPLLAVSLSVLKAFGVHKDTVEPFLLNALAPLGPQGVELANRIIGFVENVRVGLLGSIGLAFLFYTVVSLIQKIEDSMNQIWRIKKSRSLARRFSDYLVVILLGPVLIFVATGLTASIMSTRVVQKIISFGPVGALYYTAAKWLPYFFVIMAFTFVYIFILNTKVKFKAALFGGVVAGLLWKGAGWVFATFVITSTRNAIYAGFAIVILFMIWIYFNWLIFLLGGVVSFYTQYPQFIAVKKESLLLSPRLKERLALYIMLLVGDSFYHARGAWTLNGLVERIGLPVGPVQEVLILLEKKGFLKETDEEPQSYFPARALERIGLDQLMSSVREEDESAHIEGRFLSTPDIDRLVENMQKARSEVLGENTLRDLVVSHNREA